ncbi:MAG TPA: helix-turn-helix domain-containing protein [bacterium]
MNKKRIKEITIIHYKRRSIKSSQMTMTESCPVCGSVDLITVATAAQLTGVSRSVLYDWVAKNKVHAARLTNGQLRVCCHSLSEQVASCDDGIKKTTA